MIATSSRGWGWQLGLVSCLAIGGAFAASGDYVLAQITPDATLGAEGSVVTSTNDGLPTEQIDGGATRGANLFHSFEQFSIPTGSAAHFNNAVDIQNIISRVTGSSISNIDGLLRANGTANLFLLNPNGIIFGPNASLNIGGSILASTAFSLNFADGNQFSATAHPTTPLLRVSVPIGLQYGGTVGSILNQSVVGLEVQPGKTLALVGGDVRLEGGRLQALGGRIELGGLASPGSIELNMNGSRMSLSFPDDVPRGDVYLSAVGSNRARVNVAASNGGDIAITTRNIDMKGGSELRGGIERGLGFPDAQAGDIELRAQGAIAIADSFIRNKVEDGAVGNSGDINITTGSLSVTDGGLLNTSTRGQGNAGNVNINARDTVSFDGVRNTRSSAANSNVENVEPRAVGNGGDINITTGSLSLKNGAQLVASTYGEGNAGSVNINARDTVSFDGVGTDSSGATSRVELRAVGNGGAIYISTGSLRVTNGAQVGVSTNGQGNAGSVNIKARDTVSFDGVGSNGFFSRAASSVERGGVGNGGDINITAGSLSLTNGGLLDTSTYGRGYAGSVNINARDTVSFDGNSTVVTSRVEPEGVGNGGSINIMTRSLSVTNGAAVTTSTLGRGNAGSVNIHADHTVSFDGIISNRRFSSGAFSLVKAGAVGFGGSINIRTGLLSVTDGAVLSTNSEESGAAGNIEVAARSIRLSNDALLSSETKAGQGNIILRSQNLVLRRGSNITTDATDTATGGNITIDAGVIAALEDSDISANAQDASGGRVRINAQGIFGTEFRNQPTSLSDITASSELGPQFSGTVEINTPDVDPRQGLATLPAELVEASRLIATGCTTVGENEFIVTGRGGLPPNPSDTLSSETVWTDLRTFTEQAEARPSSEETTRSTNPTTEQIVEAQGWVINNRGEVVLTAHASNVTPNVPWMTPATCHSSTSHQRRKLTGSLRQLAY